MWLPARAKAPTILSTLTGVLMIRIRSSIYGHIILSGIVPNSRIQMTSHGTAIELVDCSCCLGASTRPLATNTIKNKYDAYFGQNLLVQSLNEKAYENNPGFHKFCASSGLPFKAHRKFAREDLDARQELYRRLAEQIWDPEILRREAAGLLSGDALLRSR